MKFAGLLVMPAGFFLAIAALVLLTDSTQRLAFVLSGVAVEALGFGVAMRGQLLAQRENRQ